MKICIASDAWHPQVNGVVRTLETISSELALMGNSVTHLTPDDFYTVPCPTYPEIRLALTGKRGIDRLMRQIAPDAIHIATEGPIGYAARHWCLRKNMAFTTAWHTNFPEYIAMRTALPERWLYAAMRRFHAPSSGVMVATSSVARKLASHGFHTIRPWTRGVDTAVFHPDQSPPEGLSPTLSRPIALYVGRVSVEKNISAFLDSPYPMTKVVVGDGPALSDLKTAYPDVIFTGKKHGSELARFYAAADVFVFPSRTDTFGLVMLEALASGVPVAAFPVQGPMDIIGRNGCGTKEGHSAPIGCLHTSLDMAITGALKARPSDCRTYALGYSWTACARQFLNHLTPVNGVKPASLLQVA